MLLTRENERLRRRQEEMEKEIVALRTGTGNEGRAQGQGQADGGPVQKLQRATKRHLGGSSITSVGLQSANPDPHPEQEHEQLEEHAQYNETSVQQALQDLLDQAPTVSPEGSSA